MKPDVPLVILKTGREKKKKKKKGYAHRRGLRKGPLIAEARGHLPSKQQDSGG